jgi:competence protein ComGC
MFFNNQTKKCLNLKAGGIGLYVIVFLLFGLLMSVFIFFPQFVNMQSGIYKISCREIRSKIQLAIEDHDANNTKRAAEPGEPIDLDYLKESGYLAEVQTCPENGTYFINENGEVYCSFHSKSKKTD